MPQTVLIFAELYCNFQDISGSTDFFYLISFIFLNTSSLLIVSTNSTQFHSDFPQHFLI